MLAKRWKRVSKNAPKYLPGHDVLKQLNSLESSFVTPLQSAPETVASGLKRKNSPDVNPEPPSTPKHDQLMNRTPSLNPATPSHWSPSPSPPSRRKPTSLHTSENDYGTFIAPNQSPTHDHAVLPHQKKPLGTTLVPSSSQIPALTPARHDQPNPITPSSGTKSPSTSTRESPPPRVRQVSTSKNSGVYVLLPKLRRKKPAFSPGKILVPNSSQSQERTQSLPALPSQLSLRHELPRSSRSLPHISDSQVQHEQSQPRRHIFGLSQLPNPSGSSLNGVNTSLEVSLGGSSYIPRRPLSGHKPTSKNLSATSALVKDAHPSQKLKVDKYGIDGGEETNSVARRRDMSHENQSPGADADDEAVVDTFSDSDFDSRAVDEEPEYVDEDVEDADAAADELESDDQKTDAMVREASISSTPIPENSLPTPQSSPRGSVRRRRTHSYSSDPPVLPTSPDVFLSDVSFRRSRVAQTSTSTTEEKSLERSSVIIPATSEFGRTTVPIGVSSTKPSRSNTCFRSQSPASRQLSQRSGPSKIIISAKAQAGPSTSNHDPNVWKAPSFMRNQEATNTKRRTSRSPPEEPPTKRPKVDVPEKSRAETSASHVSGQPGASSHSESTSRSSPSAPPRLSTAAGQSDAKQGPLKSSSCCLMPSATSETSKGAVNDSTDGFDPETWHILEQLLLRAASRSGKHGRGADV